MSSQEQAVPASTEKDDLPTASTTVPPQPLPREGSTNSARNSPAVFVRQGTNNNNDNNTNIILPQQPQINNTNHPPSPNASSASSNNNNNNVKPAYYNPDDNDGILEPPQSQDDGLLLGSSRSGSHIDQNIDNSSNVASPNPISANSNQRHNQDDNEVINNNISSAPTSPLGGTARNNSITVANNNNTTNSLNNATRPRWNAGASSSSKNNINNKTNSNDNASTQQQQQQPLRATSTRTNVTTRLPLSSGVGPGSRKNSPNPTPATHQAVQQNNIKSTKSPSPTNVLIVAAGNNNNDAAITNSALQQNNASRAVGTARTNAVLVGNNTSPSNNNNAYQEQQLALLRKSSIEPAPSTAFMQSSSPAITTTSRGQRPSSFSNYTIQYVKDHSVASKPIAASSSSSSSNNNKKPAVPSFFLESIGPVSGSATHNNNGNNNNNSAATSSNSRITIRALQVIEDNNTVWAAEKDGRICIFDARTGQIRRRFERRSEYFPICLAYVAPYVWIGFNDGTVRVFDPDSVACMKEAKEHLGPVNCFEGPVYGQKENSEIFSAGADFMIVRWNAVTVERISVINAHSGPLKCLSWFAPCEVLICGGDDGSLKAWTLSVPPLTPATTRTTTATVLQKKPQDESNNTNNNDNNNNIPSSQILASSATSEVSQFDYFASPSPANNTTTVGNAATNVNEQAQESSPVGLLASTSTDPAAHKHGVLCVVTCQNTIWSGGSDGSVKIWELALSSSSSSNSASSVAFKLVHEIKSPHTHAVSKLVRVGDNVWSVCLGTIFVWSGETFEEVTRYTGEHAGYITSVSVIREAAVARLWSAGAEGGFCVWNAEADLVPAARLSTHAFLKLSAFADYQIHNTTSTSSNLLMAKHKNKKQENNNNNSNNNKKSLGIQVSRISSKINEEGQEEFYELDDDDEVESIPSNVSPIGSRSASANPETKNSPTKKASQLQRNLNSINNRQKILNNNNNNIEKNIQNAASSSSYNSSPLQTTEDLSSSDIQSSIQQARALLRKHGIPTDETWRTLLCSTIFSTRLDAESVAKNYTSEASQSPDFPEIDVTTLDSISKNLDFLADEQQRRLFDIAGSVRGITLLRHLVFRTLDDGETKIPPSILSLDDWAFVNRVWLALNRRNYIVNVVKNEGVTAIKKSGISSAPTAGTSASEGDFGVTVMPAKIANKNGNILNNSSSEQEQQQPSLSDAIEGVANERNAIENDEAMFSSDQSTAQMYNWLEKQRQTILDALRTCANNNSSGVLSSANNNNNNNSTSSLLTQQIAHDYEGKLLQEQEAAERSEIRADFNELFANLCLIKMNFDNTFRKISSNAVRSSSNMFLSPNSQKNSANATRTNSNLADAITQKENNNNNNEHDDSVKGTADELNQNNAQIDFGNGGGEDAQEHQEQGPDDVCLAINTTGQLLIAQHRQSQRVVTARYAEDLDNFMNELQHMNDKFLKQQQDMDQNRKDLIQKTKEMYKMSMALAENVNANTKLRKIIDDSENASNFEFLANQLEKHRDEMTMQKQEILRLRRLEAKMNDEVFRRRLESGEDVNGEGNNYTSEDDHDAGETASNINNNNADFSPSPSGTRRRGQPPQQMDNLSMHGSDGLPHSDRTRWLAALVNGEIDKRPLKEDQHRTLLSDMQQLEVLMKERQDSSVVRQRHAAKTLAVDLASAEVTKEVALEMARLLRSRVEFFEERDSQWSKLSELLGDVARMHIDSFVFAEPLDELQKACKELMHVLDLRSILGRACGELYRLLGDIGRSLQDFRVNIEVRPQSRAQTIEFVDRTGERVGISREGVKWMLANFFSESELLHLGFSPTIFVPDEKRNKAPVPPSLMVLFKNTQQGAGAVNNSGLGDKGNNSPPNSNNNNNTSSVRNNISGVNGSSRTNNNANQSQYVDPYEGNLSAARNQPNSHGGNVMMMERDYYQPQPAAHGYLAAPMKSNDVV